MIEQEVVQYTGLQKDGIFSPYAYINAKIKLGWRVISMVTIFGDHLVVIYEREALLDEEQITFDNEVDELHIQMIRERNSKYTG